MFVSSATGDVLQSGPQAKYVIPATAVGDKVTCEVAASNAGGTALEETEATSVIKGAPQVRIAKLAPISALPGGHVTVHVSLVSPVGLWGKYNVCVTLPAKVGGHLCRSVRNPDGSAGTFPFELHVQDPPDRTGRDREDRDRRHRRPVERQRDGTAADQPLAR